MLRVTHRLQFHRMRIILSGHLSGRLSAERRLALGPTCGLEAWRYPAFEELVLEMDSISTHVDPLVPYPPWDKVCRARMRINRIRADALYSMRYTKFCQHCLAAMNKVIPFTRSSSFVEELSKVQLNAGCCGVPRTQIRIDGVYRVSSVTETNCIKSVWES